jgi:signal transduction histidine kinase
MTIHLGGYEPIWRRHSVIGMPGMVICSRGGRAVPSWPADQPAADNSPEAGPTGDCRAESVATCARIVAAADDVRRRIERDLHDGLQQRLVLLGLRARLAEASVPPDQRELKCELARIAEGLLEAMENLREISHGIHPAVLSECGLGAAVEALARRSLVPVKLNVRVEGRLPDPIEVSAYYIVCETLTNVAKHAKASFVEISLVRVEDYLDLSIQDNGVGGANGSGAGLTGLMDRVAALAGTMQLVSPPGRGTRLHIKLPIRCSDDPFPGGSAEVVGGAGGMQSSR